MDGLLDELELRLDQRLIRDENCIIGIGDGVDPIYGRGPLNLGASKSPCPTRNWIRHMKVHKILAGAVSRSELRREAVRVGEQHVGSDPREGASVNHDSLHPRRREVDAREQSDGRGTGRSWLAIGAGMLAEVLSVCEVGCSHALVGDRFRQRQLRRHATTSSYP